MPALISFVPNRIKVAVIDAEMTVHDLAEKLDLTDQTVHYYIRGERAVDTDRLCDIANITNKPIDFFFTKKSVD